MGGAREYQSRPASIAASISSVVSGPPLSLINGGSGRGALRESPDSINVMTSFVTERRFRCACSFRRACTLSGHESLNGSLHQSNYTETLPFGFHPRRL